MSKKVVVVLVEGSSDEELLIDRLRELYKGCEIRFESQRGDILYDFKSRKSIKVIVGDAVRGIVAKRKYKEKDILAVLHIMDTDGCLIPDDCIEIDESQGKKTIYTLESIKVDSAKQQQHITERNQKRSINVKTMNSTSSVVSKKYKYQLYYFSRHLEHVVFNEIDPEQEYKYENIEAFVEGLEGTVEEFLNEHLPESEATTYTEKYKNSWSHIGEGANSLKRATNVPLLFEYINHEVADEQ